MSKQQAEAYREKYRKATAQAVGTVRIWDTQSERERHLREVAEAQASGTPF
jgi:hypothetical protein